MENESTVTVLSKEQIESTKAFLDKAIADIDRRRAEGRYCEC